MENMITISTQEYVNLLESKMKLTLLKDALLRNATLSYDKKTLYFSDSTITPVLILIDKEGYDKKLNELLDENF